MSAYLFDYLIQCGTSGNDSFRLSRTDSYTGAKVKAMAWKKQFPNEDVTLKKCDMKNGKQVIVSVETIN